jgi:hypothetical protein
MLELRPNCECCDRDLAPDSLDARICTFECTFCAECANGVLQNVCPNCGGELVRRPVRPTEKRLTAPPSGKRVYKPLTPERLEKHAAYLRRYSGIEPDKR